MHCCGFRGEIKSLEPGLFGFFWLADSQEGGAKGTVSSIIVWVLGHQALEQSNRLDPTITSPPSVLDYLLYPGQQFPAIR